MFAHGCTKQVRHTARTKICQKIISQFEAGEAWARFDEFKKELKAQKQIDETQQLEIDDLLRRR